MAQIFGLSSSMTSLEDVVRLFVMGVARVIWITIVTLHIQLAGFGALPGLYMNVAIDAGFVLVALLVDIAVTRGYLRVRSHAERDADATRDLIAAEIDAVAGRAHRAEKSPVSRARVGAVVVVALISFGVAMLLSLRAG